MQLAGHPHADWQESLDNRHLHDRFDCAQLSLAQAIQSVPVSLPTDAKERKRIPLYSGLVAYFPDALIAVAHCSQVGNDQHNPGQPLHWERSKSQDHRDCLMRHLFDDAMGVPEDKDGVEHLAKVAWRALAELQLAIERNHQK